MKNYENFKQALNKSKEKDYRMLRKEVKTIEKAIEAFLEKALECTAAMSEKDFLVYPL